MQHLLVVDYISQSELHMVSLSASLIYTQVITNYYCHSFQTFSFILNTIRVFILWYIVEYITLIYFYYFQEGFKAFVCITINAWSVQESSNPPQAALSQSTWSSASQPGRQPVNLDGSQSPWTQLPVSLVFCQSTWTAASQPGPSCQSAWSSACQPGRQPVNLATASQPDQQPVNLASSQSTWPVASSAIGLQNMGDPLWCPLRGLQWKSGDIHYWSVDHQWYHICTLTSVIT